MQFRPRLTGASGSPWVATTLLFCTPTSTEQPVPQKRHGALSQRMTLLALACSADSTVVGTAMPAVAAAAATALALMKSRLFSDMVELPLPVRSEEHTSELQSRENLVCRLLLEKKKDRQKL